MKRKGNFNLSVGASSILMIFVVLCLTTFGILSYVTANADSKISTKNAETVENYYAGATAAEKILQEIDDSLLSARHDAEQAVESGTCKSLKYYSLYKDRVQLQSVNTILESDKSKEQKCDICYRSFTEMLLTRLPGVTLEAGQGAEPLLATFVTDAGGGRQIETKLTVNPYGDIERYKITGKKLISSQTLDGDAGETLQLWQGSSAQ